MERKAADNEYLHKDFHGALSIAIEYVHRHFGAAAVREYLQQFAAAYYAPFTADVKKRGLLTLKEYFEKIYKIEGADVEIKFSRDELFINVAACPAVARIRKQKLPVAELFYEVT